MTTTTVRFTDDDRDSRGFIRLSPPDAAEDAPAESEPIPPAAPRAVAPQRLRMSPRLRYQLTISGAAVVGLLLVLMTMRFSAPRAMVAPTAPATTAAPAAAVPTPNPQPPTPNPAMLPAYASPDGARLGEIEDTRAITPTAHFGGDWIQADVQGSGRIWLRAADWPALTIVGPDLAPRPTRVPAAPPTEPPPPPTQCAEAGVPGKMVSSCGYDDLSALEAQAKQQWIATYGGSIGMVSTPSPQIRSTP